MFKIVTAGLLLATALAVFFLGQLALIVVAGISFGLVLGEIVDAVGKGVMTSARKGGEGRVKGRELRSDER
ncbi:hypothetical protein [Chloroflexus sp.]|uniref:hypothetical protein n=1 Tax=Chloroflexus sp. TaxID=1904827 RepID=UPI002ACDF9A0|nr:hypothetical protein [Chloroflexus sp.]